MKLLNRIALMALAVVGLTACSDNEGDEPSMPEISVDGLFIVNNGNYGYGNGTLSFYNPQDGKVSNEIFYKANGMKLGDTPQSMSITSAGVGLVCVNVSNVVFAIDINTYKEVGRISGIPSPRHAVEVSRGKIYVTMMYSNKIAVVDATSYTITGYIEIPDMDPAMGDAEQIIVVGDYAYVNCWSYQNRVLKIDTKNDKIVDQAITGLQPESMVYNPSDASLMVLCDGGGWEANPAGYEAPRIQKIDLGDFGVSDIATLELGVNVSKLCISGNKLLWLQNGVATLDLSAAKPVPQTLIASQSWGLYALTVNPVNGDIYVGDAIDYMQPGVVTHYDKDGSLLGEVGVGIIPAGFCWKLSEK